VDDEVEKDQMWVSEERGGTGAGFKGLHLLQGHMTVDLTNRNNENDVIRI
jgi:hypothetical protein